MKQDIILVLSLLETLYTVAVLQARNQMERDENLILAIKLALNRGNLIMFLRMYPC